MRARPAHVARDPGRRGNGPRGLGDAHESICSAAGALGEGGCLLDAAPTAESVFALGDLDLIGRGGDFLAGTASSALRSAEAITPVPLPAAAWLLAMGLGGLGLMGRRRRETLPSFRDGDGVEPLAASLRNSARTEAADHRRARVRLDGFRRLIDAFRDSLLNAARPHAFAPGRSSPCRPEGGAGSLWAAVAKRGPPEGDAIERAGGNPHPMPAGASALSFGDIGITRASDGLGRLFARFFRTPEAPFAVPALAPVSVVAFRRYGFHGPRHYSTPGGRIAVAWRAGCCWSRVPPGARRPEGFPARG